MKKVLVLLISLLLLLLLLLLVPESAGAPRKPDVSIVPHATLDAPQKTYLPSISGAPAPAPTPTATPTPTTTPTASPTPTGQPAGVTILDNQTAYVGITGSLYILGEVHNATQANVRLVKITGDIMDAGGATLTDGWTYAPAKVIDPGDRACFQLLVNPAPAGWASYRLNAPTYRTDGVPLTGLTLLNLSGKYVSTFHWYELTGLVRNDGSQRVEDVQPVATLFDSQGDVVGCFFTYVAGRDLDPGSGAEFKITFSGGDYTDVSSYRVQVNGTPK